MQIYKLPMLEQHANMVYDALVKYCGASNDNYNRQRFIETQITMFCSEYRFIGNLGFGGKFWRSNNKWYVSQYREHETPETVKMIDGCNKHLHNIRDVCLSQLPMNVDMANMVFDTIVKNFGPQLESLRNDFVTSNVPYALKHTFEYDSCTFVFTRNYHWSFKFCFDKLGRDHYNKQSYEVDKIVSKMRDLHRHSY